MTLRISVRLFLKTIIKSYFFQNHFEIGLIFWLAYVRNGDPVVHVTNFTVECMIIYSPASCKLNKYR